MGSPVEDAEQAIRELIVRRDAGELSEDAFRQQALPYAAIIAEARKAAYAASAPQWRDLLASAVNFAERDPAAVQAAVAGLIHGLGHYLRTSAASE